MSNQPASDFVAGKNGRRLMFLHKPPGFGLTIALIALGVVALAAVALAFYSPPIALTAFGLVTLPVAVVLLLTARPNLPRADTAYDPMSTAMIDQGRRRSSISAGSAFVGMMAKVLGIWTWARRWTAIRKMSGWTWARSPSAATA